MKNTFIIFALIFSISTFAQSDITFKKLPKDTVLILLDKQLKGGIEIEGHVFDNDKREDPIRIKATIEGVEIYDKKKKYNYRKCSLENCQTTHLEVKNYLLRSLSLIKFTTN